MINHTNKSMKSNIKKEFDKWWTEEYGCSACDYGVCRVRYQKAIWKWFSKVLDKSVEEARKGERENTIKMLKRLKLETEVCVCECGKPWKGTDLDILIGEYIDTLKNTQTK